VAPVFALNYGDSEDTDVPDGLDVALSRFGAQPPPIRVSPIFFGLADEDGGQVEDAAL
jgi:hypothetical protein